MQEIQSIFYIKFFLGLISVLLGSNIAVILFVARKYMKQADEDHKKINDLYGEHMIFHKKDTGLKFGG